MISPTKRVLLLFCLFLIFIAPVIYSRLAFAGIEVKELFETGFQLSRINDWSPDGKQIIYFDDGLYIYDISTHATSDVLIDPGEHTDIRNIRWISDETIVFSRRKSNQANWQLVSFDITTHLLHVIVSGQKFTDFCWLPTENSIVYIDDVDAVWTVNIENFTARQAYEPHDEEVFRTIFLESIACDPVSSRFAIVEHHVVMARRDYFAIKTVDLTNESNVRELDQYHFGRGPFSDISWSYDGKWIAERHTTGGSFNTTTINLYTPDGTQSFKNILNIEQAIKIEWSPIDYTMLALSVNRGKSNVYKLANFAEVLK